jgi:hypothetical protein
MIMLLYNLIISACVLPAVALSAMNAQASIPQPPPPPLFEDNGVPQEPPRTCNILSMTSYGDGDEVRLEGDNLVNCQIIKNTFVRDAGVFLPISTSYYDSGGEPITAAMCWDYLSACRNSLNQ